MANKTNHRVIVSKLVRGIVGISILVVAVWMFDWSNILSVASNLSTTMFVVTIVVLLLEFPFLGYRWHLLIRDKSALNLYRHLRLYFVATFFNTFTPGQLGGDAYRFISHNRNGIPSSILVGRLFKERLFGLMSFLTFFLICWAYAEFSGHILATDKSVIRTVGVLVVLALVAIALSNPLIMLIKRLGISTKYKWGRAILNTIEEMVKFGPFYQGTNVFLLGTVGGGFIWTLAVMVVARDLGETASFALLGMAAIMSDLIRLIPITIQGVGVREASFAIIFEAMGLDPLLGFVIGAVSYIAVLIATALIGIIGYLLPEELPSIVRR